jgi:hypothetical protein
MNFLNAFLKCEFKNASYLKYTLPIQNCYLIKWFPSSKTNIHGHDGKQCDFFILNGSLFEKRYGINGIVTYDILQPFTKYSINDQIGAHSMYNTDDKVKWSIHKYY